MSIPFDNSYVRLPERFFTRQEPTPVPNPKLLRANHKLAGKLGIDADWLNSGQSVAVFAGNGIPEGAEPLAQAYAGHQFGGFVPQLGDGRAILLGEVVDGDGTRRDIQLKGSGRTPFSRGGDGKSALGPVLREYILSEAMHALGIPTTRALAAVASGESVYRQEGAVPGGVFTRVAASHIRVGTFQYFYARNDTDALRVLADYTIARHYPAASDSSNPYVSLLESVVAAQASLIARWMSVGFIHGVMNTDNTAISGETIDFGPCAFMEEFHPKCVFSSIDRNARYAWGNQPEFALWNLTRFAETLLPLIDGGSNDATALAETALGAFPAQFQNHYARAFRAKLGLPEENTEFIKVTLGTLAAQQVDFTLFFRHLTRAAAGGDNHDLSALFADRTAFETWYAEWQSTAIPEKFLAKMRAANPIITPRNHRIEQTIQAAYKGDFTPFQRLCNALENPFDEGSEFADLEARPRPEEVVRETFCGT